MTTLPIVDHWFERKTVDDSITLLWEPHVIPLMRCNIWHVRGRDRDLVIDTGMGLMSLSDELADLVDKNVTAVATHGHDDHIGGHHEFADVRRVDREQLCKRGRRVVRSRLLAETAACEFSESVGIGGVEHC